MTTRRARLAVGPTAVLPVSVCERMVVGFPSRPVTWVMTYPPDGLGDTLSRLLADKLQASLRQPVIVEDKPGASSPMAAAYVKQQTTSGHTLLYGDLGLVLSSQEPEGFAAFIRTETAHWGEVIWAAGVLIE